MFPRAEAVKKFELLPRKAQHIVHMCCQKSKHIDSESRFFEYFHSLAAWECSRSALRNETPGRWAPPPHDSARGAKSCISCLFFNGPHHAPQRGASAFPRSAWERDALPAPDTAEHQAAATHRRQLVHSSLRSPNIYTHTLICGRRRCPTNGRPHPGHSGSTVTMAIPLRIAPICAPAAALRMRPAPSALKNLLNPIGPQQPLRPAQQGVAVCLRNLLSVTIRHRLTKFAADQMQ